MASSSPRWPLLILLVAVAAVFQQTWGFDFIWDDHLLVVENQSTANLADLSAMFSADLWEGTPDLDGSTGYYRPLLLVDLALTRAIAGLHPGAHHLHSLLWHLLAIVGVYWLLRAIIDVPWAAATGAAVFALHPVQVEAVAFVSARNDPMATALLVWAVLLLSGKDPRIRTLLGGAVLALCALLCKESVILAPLLLPLVCRARGPDWGARRSHLVLLGAMGAGLALRWNAGIGVPAQADAAHVAGSILPTLAHYSSHLIWPVNLPPVVHLGWPPAVPWVPAGITAVLAIGLALWGRRHVVLGLGMAGLGLAPALVAVAHTGIIVDRYLYLPMVGLSLVVAGAAARFPRQPVGFGLLAGGLAALSLAYLPSWQGDDALWRTTMNRAPSGYAAGAHGRWLEDHRYLKAAALAYGRAVEPPRPFPESCYNITRIHLALAQPGNIASVRAQAALAVGAGRKALQAGCARSPELVAPLARALAITGDWAAAETEAKTVRQDPTGWAIVVRLAARARVEDLAPLRGELATAGEQGQKLIDLVTGLIAQSGESEKAVWLRAQLVGAAI